MALINEITRLRDNSLSSLDASHNYHAHTKTSWRLVQQMVREGHKFTIRNQATGNIVDETELSGLAQNYKKRAQPLNSTHNPAHHRTQGRYGCCSSYIGIIALVPVCLIVIIF